MAPRTDPAEYMNCRFCGEACDSISNSCATCRRMKGKMSDRAYLAQIEKIVLHLHRKRVSRGIDEALTQLEKGK